MICQLGRSVSLSGDTLAIADAENGAAGAASGAGYIFRFDGTSWNEKVKLVASDGAADDRAGWSVDGIVASNTTVMLGAPFNDVNGVSSGAVYFFDLDSDDDGLINVDEADFGTDPTNPDTDADGLLDGTEVLVAEGSGCPNPLNPDSDGDTISDGDEADLGTNPCLTDSDADGVPDDIDDEPTEPGVSTGFIEDALRALCDDVIALNLSVFDAPNDNARRGRRNALCNKLQAAANAIASGDLQGALDKIDNDLVPKLDGEPAPGDWMVDGAEKGSLLENLQLMAALIALEL